MLVRALAAVVLGRMDNFPRIAAAAIGLGIVEQAIVFDTGRDLYVFPVLFVIVVVGLLLEPRGTGSRVDDQAVSSWQAAREVRPIPTELRSIPAVRWAAALPLALVLLFVLTLPLWLSDSKLLIATVTGIISIVAVSLVLLTGWAGHVSLGQMAFAAVGGALGALGHPERRLGSRLRHAGGRARGRDPGRRRRASPRPAPEGSRWPSPPSRSRPPSCSGC